MNILNQLLCIFSQTGIRKTTMILWNFSERKLEVQWFAIQNVVLLRLTHGQTRTTSTPKVCLLSMIFLQIWQWKSFFINNIYIIMTKYSKCIWFFSKAPDCSTFLASDSNYCYSFWRHSAGTVPFAQTKTYFNFYLVNFQSSTLACPTPYVAQRQTKREKCRRKSQLRGTSSPPRTLFVVVSHNVFYTE